MAMNPLVLLALAAGGAVLLMKKKGGESVVDGGTVAGPNGVAEWRVRQSGAVFYGDFRLGEGDWLVIQSGFPTKEEAAAAATGAAMSAAGISPGAGGLSQDAWASISNLFKKAKRKKAAGTIGL